MFVLFIFDRFLLTYVIAYYIMTVEVACEFTFISFFMIKGVVFMKSTRKAFAILLAVLMLFALAACTDDGVGSKKEEHKKVAEDTSILEMSFSAPEEYDTVQRSVEKTTEGKLISKGINYTLSDDRTLSLVFTDANGQKLEDELGEMEVERKEYNGTELIIYRSSKKTYMAFCQKGENVYGIQYRAASEETIEDEFEKILQTVKFTDSTETTLNDFKLDKITYNTETDVPLYSETTYITEKPDGTLIKKSFVWKYSSDSQKMDYRFGIEEQKNVKLEDVLDAKKEYQEAEIGDVTYKFEKSEDKESIYDYYNYYVQQGEDVYVVSNKGVSNGLFTSRSKESVKAFEGFINAVSFK